MAERERLAFGEGEAATAVAPTRRLRQAAARMKLPDGKGIDEFIGEHDERTLGKSSSLACQRTGTRVSLRVFRCASTMTGLVLDERYREGFEEFRHGHARRGAHLHQGAAPGPKLGDVTGTARPSTARPRTDQRPISSPKIWLISGDVMKSPRRRSAGGRLDA
jgi:hypothetical protein